MFSPEEIRQQVAAGNRRTDGPLVIDLREAMSPGLDVNALNEWLARHPQPVVGVGLETTPLRAGLDIIVADRQALASVESAIKKNPHAASVLVQTTRIVEQLPYASALVAESLAYATLQGGAEFRGWLSAHRQDRQHARSPEPTMPSAPDETSGEPVLLERADGHLQVILNRPGNRNALSVEMRDGLTEAFSLVAMDPTICEVSVKGLGPCFSAGGDLSEFGSCEDPAEAHRIRQLCMPARFLADHAGRYTFYLHGACIGAGIELPAFAARVVAAPGSWFRLPEVAMGLIPGAGGCVSLTRRIGRHRTNYLAVTGEDLSVDQALDWGLVDVIENWSGSSQSS